MTEPPAVSLFPAIDLRGGRCVRLEQGEAARQTTYDDDPVARAARFVEEGARWVHVVDLDAALGTGSNRAVIERIAAESGARVQTGGGIRSAASLDEVLSLPAVSRVVVGTAAIEDPAFVEQAIARWGADRIVVGLDARGVTPAIRGWQEETSANLFDLGVRLAESGVRTFLYTDISRDGMFSGPNIPMSIELSQQSGADVLVSGGVGSLEDIAAIREAARLHAGITGVIVGKAIYEGRVGVREAVEVLRA